MPVGTQATVKAQTVDSLTATGSQCLLANTYHLLLRPGPEVFERMGGIHRFMNWTGSVLTDSGGFQIFSLPTSRQLSPDGAEFRSYLDGMKILLSPEKSIATQRAIGSDIMMVLDQCVPGTADHRLATEAMRLTHDWARRSLVARGDSRQALFGIVQGACHPDLRRESAQFLSDLPFDGLAIGGLAVGEERTEREDITECATAAMPRDLPRYLMGVGTPIDLLEAVHRGVDMFDCILPSARAQQGTAYTSRGWLALRRTVYRFSDLPLDPDCDCPTCRSYSRAYLHHLIKSEEVLGWHLIGVHNLHFYHRLMARMRAAIAAGTFLEFYHAYREPLTATDLENPVTPPKRARRHAKQPPSRLGEFDLHIQPAGFASVRHRPSGEIMHSVSRPEEEAERLYVEQPRLPERFAQPSAPPLVIWDVGMGAASNAMAAIAAWDATPGDSRRELHLWSFENDLNPLRLAAANPQHFAHGNDPRLQAILKHSYYESPCRKFRWRLVQGDFPGTLATYAATPPAAEIAPGEREVPRVPQADVIFYDPFSYKTNAALWEPSIFQTLFDYCIGHTCELYTYTSATTVRSALLCAGFYVARGLSTGPKAETTWASSEWLPEAAHDYLGADWLVRWDRSGVRDATRDAAVHGHPQFKMTPSPVPAF